MRQYRTGLTRKKNYKVFDIGYQHGHFFTVFDKAKSHQLITQISNTIQLSKNAWIQFVFASYPLTDQLQKHISKISKHYSTVIKSDYVGQFDGIISEGSGPRDHPEKFGDFATHYKTIEQFSNLKTQSMQTLLSIRGVVDSNEELSLDFSEIESLPVENIRSNIEHVTKNNYSLDSFHSEKKPQHITINKQKTRLQRVDIFAKRLIPYPDEFLPKIINDYTSKDFLGRYKERKSPPFLIVSPEEMSLFIHLPDPKTKNLTITRKQSMPQQQMNKDGYCLGYFSRKKSLEYDASSFFGDFVSSAETKSVVLSKSDFPTHMYLVGGTGSGKTTLLRGIAKHLEMSNINGNFPNSFIFVDPKGSDSYEFLTQIDDITYQNDNVIFLDPIQTKFSINIFELPEYKPDNRDSIVSQYVGMIMKMIETWYNGSDSFVRLNRILDTLLQYLYLNNDKPTFQDLYEIIVAIQADGEEILSKIFRELGKPEHVMQQAIKSIATMSKEAYEPVLNRVEKFVTDKVLYHMFCVRGINC